MNKSKTKQRFVSMALAMLMLVTGVMPTSAFAQEMPTTETLPAVTETAESTHVESGEATSVNEEAVPSEETTNTEAVVEETTPEAEPITEKTSAPLEEVVTEPATESTSKPEEATLAGPEVTEELAQPMEITEPSNENETPGDPIGTVTSEDGFTRITDFDIYWESGGDTAIYRPEKTRDRLKIDWAISGERIYRPGQVELHLPSTILIQNADGEAHYYANNFPVPKAILNLDGTINFNANYDSATFAYVIEDNTVKIINIKDLAPRNSGTYTVDYSITPNGPNSNYKSIPHGEELRFESSININLENDEIVTRKDEAKIITEFNAPSVTLSKKVSSSQISGGYLHIIYNISSKITSFRAYDYVLKDVFSKTDGQEFVSADYTIKYGHSLQSKTEGTSRGTATVNNEGEIVVEFSDTSFYPEREISLNVITRVPRELAQNGERHDFLNNANSTLTARNPEEGLFTELKKQASATFPYIDQHAHFTASPGRQELVKGFSTANSSNRFDRMTDLITQTNGLSTLKEKGEVALIPWLLSSTVVNFGSDFVVSSLGSYDGLGDVDDISSYGEKTYKHILSDDYLYLGTDYTRELTNQDYQVDKIEINEKAYEFKETTEDGAGYFDYTNLGNQYNRKFPPKITIYARKSSTSEWVKMAYYEGLNDVNKTAENFEAFVEGVSYTYGSEYFDSDKGISITLPDGYINVRAEVETSAHKDRITMRIFPTLFNSEYVQQAHEDFKELKIRNDATLALYNDGELVAIKGTTERTNGNSRTLDLDLIDYGAEMYHKIAYNTLKEADPPTYLSAITKEGTSTNDVANQRFNIRYNITANPNVQRSLYYNNYQKDFSEKGRFYDLLPLGVTINPESISVKGDRIVDKTTKEDSLKFEYELIPNWRSSGRTMLVVNYHDAELKDESWDLSSDPTGREKYLYMSVVLSFDAYYSWDAYKDYGSQLKNLAAYEYGGDELANGEADKPVMFISHDLHTLRIEFLTTTTQERELMTDLNPEHDNKSFMYTLSNLTLNGNLIANTGLTKHVKDLEDESYTLSTTTTEGNSYSYKLRLQTIPGTTADDIIFYDSLENYNPLPTDEDYGVERWKGTLESIDLSQPLLRGVDPVVYYSTVENLVMQESRDLSDASIWSKERPSDLSQVQAIAVDLSRKMDGTPFKLGEEESITVVVNMKAPFGSEDFIGKKALNEVYANTTVTTVLDDVSENKLINMAYTAIELEPVNTEINLNATKKYLDKDGNDMVLKGDDFTFELKDSEGNTLQTKTNAADGSIAFDPIMYNPWDVGEYTYTVNEVKGSEENIAYDGHVEIIKVKVERTGDSEPTATVTYDEDGATFTNRLVEDTTAKIEASKTYFGRGGLKEQPEAEAFEFILKDSEGTEIGRAKNDAEGNIVFGDITFNASQIGEHKYTIEEVQGADPKIQYDEHIEEVTINVSLNESFELVAEVVYDEDGAAFENRLRTTSLQLVKLSEGTEEFELEEITNEDDVVVGYRIPEAQLANTLDGAVYELYRVEGETETLVGTLTTENGISNIVEDLLAGTYKLVEVTAPEGHYISDEDMTFEITDADAGTVIAKFATDEGLEDLPSTGGTGTKALMATGGVLIVVMGSLLYVANKKRRRAQ